MPLLLSTSEFILRIYPQFTLKRVSMFHCRCLITRDIRFIPLNEFMVSLCATKAKMRFSYFY